MAKREPPASRKAVSTRARPVLPASSSLLQLPAEIRCMIWKAVVDTPILLVEAGWTQDRPCRVNAVRSRVLGPEFIESSCDGSHKKQKLKKKSTEAPGPLSWLRTNRQIYTEAQPIVYHDLSLHICSGPALEAMVSDLLPQTHLRREKIRSLSFCVRILIEHDLREGYTFVKTVIFSDIDYYRGDREPCYCFWCSAGLPHDGPSLDMWFPKLEEVRLRIYFGCHRGQGNDRPVIGRWKNGRKRHGQLVVSTEEPFSAGLGRQRREFKTTSAGSVQNENLGYVEGRAAQVPPGGIRNPEHQARPKERMSERVRSMLVHRPECGFGKPSEDPVN